MAEGEDRGGGWLSRASGRRRWLWVLLAASALLVGAAGPAAPQWISAPNALFKSTLHGATIDISGIYPRCSPATASFYNH